jgi:hypothetical protein
LVEKKIELQQYLHALVELVPRHAFVSPPPQKKKKLHLKRKVLTLTCFS